MAISQKRYVDITSGVAVQPQAARREFILRCMTSNEIVQFDKVLEFTAFSEVSEYFGATSEEAAYASKYFAFTSKDVTKPEKISFARFVKSATLAKTIGNGIKPSLAEIKALGESAEFTIGEHTYEVDVSSATSFADVAAAVNTEMAASSCSYSNAYGAFVYTGEVAANISGALAAAMGLSANTNPVSAPALTAETPAEAMARTTGISDNFGSFLFIDTISVAEAAAVAEWLNTDEQHGKFMFCVQADDNTDTALRAALNGYDGVWVQEIKTQKSEYMPAAILAATDFSRNNGTQSYMFQQFPGAEVVVSDNSRANTLDGMKINYYGATQTAGRQIAFLQRGVLQGAISDAGVYANEMWLKDSFTTAFLNLLLAINKIPANKDGAAMARTVMQETLDLALANGTIIPGKEFDAAQKAGINAMVGRSTAANEVYSDGYAIDVNVVTDPNDPDTKIIKYLLVYSKGDAIRKVVGNDVLA